MKWGKHPAQAGQNRGFTVPPKSLLAIIELQCDCVSTNFDWSNKTKNLFQPINISNPVVI